MEGASRVIPKLALYKAGRKLEARAGKGLVICEISELALEKGTSSGKWAISRLSFDKGARQRLLTESVLFIGTQFSNLYTAVDTPVTFTLKLMRQPKPSAVCQTQEQKQNQERSTNCLHFKENTLHIACLLVVLDTGCGHRMWLLFSKAPPCPYVWACHCDTQRLVSHSLLLLRAYGSSGSGSTLAGALVPPHSSDAGSWATAKYKPPGLMTYTMTPRKLLLRVVEASAS